ncbi:MAG: hypothetical protein SF162_17190 [bacterium]|nr:hypothetical protein [bacterium]
MIQNVFWRIPKRVLEIHFTHLLKMEDIIQSQAIIWYLNMTEAEPPRMHTVLCAKANTYFDRSLFRLASFRDIVSSRRDGPVEIGFFVAAAEEINPTMSLTASVAMKLAGLNFHIIQGSGEQGLQFLCSRDTTLDPKTAPGALLPIKQLVTLSQSLVTINPHADEPEEG